ncbi:MAG TPA: hypothetical protein VEU47_16250 [Candidatus Cybelea sp.]|nr:hypothetical protein [Candidatus Cybelea sp.]
MTKLQYTEAELFAEHAYARPQIEAGYRLHGGFDASGNYQSPRTLMRWPAVRAWGKQLEARGWPLIDATTKLLSRGNYPSFEQQKLLLDWGMGQTLWNSITITGVIEARGKRLAEFAAPDFQSIIVEDISATTTGHLHKGLLAAHGYDEGGRADKGEGGHDTMWFAVRDLLFGKDAYPLPQVPESIARPELGRLMPQIPLAHEQTILMLMNVLMIEIRAERAFQFYIRVARDPSLFRDRRADAEHAAELVERIRQDEAIHVAYLQAAVSELRSFTFKTEAGGTIAGKDFIDPIWNGMVQWHSVTTVDHSRAQTRDAISASLKALPDGERKLAALDAVDKKEAA